MALTEILRYAARSDWTAWLVTSTTSSAAETRAFLDRALSHLPTASHNRVAKRLQRGDAAGIDAVLHELVAFETCRTLHLSPTFEPGCWRTATGSLDSDHRNERLVRRLRHLSDRWAESKPVSSAVAM
jgi:hypothetical protein